MPSRRGLRLVLATASIALIVACSPRHVERVAYKHALPPSTAEGCVEPEPRERRLFELAASAVELGDVGAPNWLDSGAQRQLASGLFRQATGGSTQGVCIPSDVLLRVSAALKSRGGFGKLRLAEYQLELAARLPDPDPKVIEAVAASAFHAVHQPSDLIPTDDIRPYARTILAGFGSKAKAYAQQARLERSVKDAMGTGAAQIAAASGDPEALAWIARSMEEVLASVPPYEAIPYDRKWRLYELAWGIVYAGEAGRSYTAAIRSAMQRKVQSHAPPFGMVDLHPKQLCEVLERIEGEATLRLYSYCVDRNAPIDR